MPTTTNRTTKTTSAIIEPAGILRETEKAILFRFDQGSDTWLPKSQLKEAGFVGGVAGTRKLYEVPLWLVRQNGLLLNRSHNPLPWD